MQQVLVCSVSYRIATGPQQGRKGFALQTISYSEKCSYGDGLDTRVNGYPKYWIIEKQSFILLIL
jgi:hypothetical protein